jgi:hypothetical protein
MLLAHLLPAHLLPVYQILRFLHIIDIHASQSGGITSEHQLTDLLVRLKNKLLDACFAGCPQMFCMSPPA